MHTNLQSEKAGERQEVGIGKGSGKLSGMKDIFIILTEVLERTKGHGRVKKN